MVNKKKGRQMKLTRLTIALSMCFSTIACAEIQEQLVSSKIEAGFSPGNAQNLVISEIKKAKKTIDLAAYAFTSKEIAQELISAKINGVHVRVIADKKMNSQKYSIVDDLQNYGIETRLNNKYSIHHNKFMVIDNKVVQTGSFNYTAGAVNRNAENVIIIRGDKKLAGKYGEEFNRLWTESENTKND